MILTGWAKLNDTVEQFNGETVHSVEIAIGRNKQGQRASFFVISKKGEMFSTDALARYEIHRLHDLDTGSDDEEHIKRWLMQNIEHNWLHDTINHEKLKHLTMYQFATTCQRVVDVLFENSDFDCSFGLQSYATDEMVRDFFVFNRFKKLVTNKTTHNIDEVNVECIGVRIRQNEAAKGRSVTQTQTEVQHG